MVPTFYAAIVALWASLSSGTGMLRLQTLSCVLGGTTAISLPLLGGADLLVPSLCIPFFVARAIKESPGAARSWRLSKPGFLLCTAVLWGVLVTIFVPRLMAGEMEIITVDRLSAIGTELVPLHPVSGNITQTVYAIGNAATFLAARRMLRDLNRVLAFRDAALWLATLNCAFALLNLAEHYLHLSLLLPLVRTAGAVFEPYEIAGTGMVRVTGSFPETSVFSGFTLCMFAFTSNLWFAGVKRLWTGALSALALTFLIISTSGTAYAGLGLYAAVLLISSVYRGVMSRQISRTTLLATVLVSTALISGGTLALGTQFADRVAELFKMMVVNKMETSSGKTRSSWNSQAWMNLLDSYGLGVGFGTARPSSFVFVILASLGVVGTVFYLAFLWQVLKPLRGRTVDGDPLAAVARAGKHGVLGCLCGIVFSGPSIDPGAFYYMFAAVATVGSEQLTRRPLTLFRFGEPALGARASRAL